MSRWLLTVAVPSIIFSRSHELVVPVVSKLVISLTAVFQACAFRLFRHTTVMHFLLTRVARARAPTAIREKRALSEYVQRRCFYRGLERLPNQAQARLAPEVAVDSGAG